MAHVSEETKTKIDRMNEAELLEEVELGRNSTFQNRNFDYIVSRHTQVREKRLRIERSENLKFPMDQTEIAKMQLSEMQLSNDIALRSAEAAERSATSAKYSADTAKTAVIASYLAILVGLLTIAVLYL